MMGGKVSLIGPRATSEWIATNIELGCSGGAVEIKMWLVSGALVSLYPGQYPIQIVWVEEASPSSAILTRPA